MPCYIYMLYDPIVPMKGYVGWTVRPKVRLRSHIKEAMRSNRNTYKLNWIRSLMSVGLEPKMEIIEAIHESVWQDSEKFWIAHFKSVGWTLTNSTSGGGVRPPKAGLDHPTRGRMPHAHMDRLFKSRIGKEPWNKGKKMDEAYREIRRKTVRITDKTRAACSAGAIARNKSRAGKPLPTRYRENRYMAIIVKKMSNPTLAELAEMVGEL